MTSRSPPEKRRRSSVSAGGRRKGKRKCQPSIASNSLLAGRS
uniref:Uncharacterized protein n=1 Tax=Anopheles albimanus TaxID=7167 RepID=A0A182F4W0_ANOAL